MLVRIKHPDPHARTSLAEAGPDERGGFLINMDKLGSAQAMGWKVVNPGEDAPQPPAPPAVEAAPEPAPEPAPKPSRGLKLKGAGAA